MQAWWSVDLSSIACEGCGIYDASLRHSVHPTVVSVLVTATQKGNSGIWCSRCRGIQSVKATAMTLFTGWWSLRGPMLTVAALRANLSDGDQNATKNAQLLRALAVHEYENDNPEFAAMFALAAHEVQPQRENSRLMDELRIEGHRGITVPPSPWRYAALAPVVLFALLVVALGLRFMHRGAAETPAVDRAAVAPVTPATTSRATYQPLKAVSKTTGSADELERQLSEHPDPATARAYFKARLTEFKGELRPRLERGDDLMLMQSSIQTMGSNPAMTQFLSNPAVRTAYDNLVTAINDATRYYHGGAPLEAIQRTAGETMIVSADMTLDAIDAESRGHIAESGAIASDVASREQAVEDMKRDVRMRGAVLALVTNAIDACLKAAG